MRWAGKAWSAEFDAAKIVRHRHPVYERVRALLEALFPKEHLWLDRASANSCEYGAIHFREYTLSLLTDTNKSTARYTFVSTMSTRRTLVLST